MADSVLYIFVGSFENENEALKYCTEWWDDEPDDNASDEEYAQWEDTNPHWSFREELDRYLDSDFVEFHDLDGKNMIDYLSVYHGVTSNEAQKFDFRGYSHVLLVSSEALDGNNDEPLQSTSQMKYLGQCRANY